MSISFVDWQKERLEEVVELWNQELSETFPMRKELLAQNSFQDENVFYDASQIAVNAAGKVVGFVVAKKWQEQLEVGMNKELGWIQVLLVDSTYRKQGIGTSLLNHAEKVLQKAGIKQISLGRDPWHYFPGIPKELTSVQRWFEEKNYEKQDKWGDDYDVICHYDNDTVPPLPAKDGVTFSLLKKEEAKDLLEFFHRCFPGRWEYETLKYFEKGGDGREFVVAKKEERIIGFCRINDEDSPYIAQNVYWAPLFDGKLAGIGPLGVDRAERKHGYGLAVVEAAVSFLRQRQVNTIVIDWTGLTEFYGKLGYEIWKGYCNYRKTL